MSLFNKLFLGFCLCFCLTTARAQYRFDSWTTENGLPQNSVYDILQTPDGYLWLATLDGLARFDGVRFTVFNKANTPGIKSNRFTVLFSSGDGGLWAATDNGGVTRLSKSAAKTFTTADGLPFNNIRGITGDDAGSVWVLAGDQIMRFENERFLPADLGGLETSFHNSQWKRNVFFGVKDDALFRFEKGNLTSQKFDRAFLESLNFRLEEDANKLLWAGTKDGKVARIENGAVAEILKATEFVGGQFRELPPAAKLNFDF